MADPGRSVRLLERWTWDRGNACVLGLQARCDDSRVNERLLNGGHSRQICAHKKKQAAMGQGSVPTLEQCQADHA